MFCHKCRNNIADGAEFCHKCGAKTAAKIPDTPELTPVLTEDTHTPTVVLKPEESTVTPKPEKPSAARTKKDCNAYLNRYISREFPFSTTHAFLDGYVPQNMKICKVIGIAARVIEALVSFIILIIMFSRCSALKDVISGGAASSEGWSYLVTIIILGVISSMVPKVAHWCLIMWIKDKLKLISSEVYTVSSKVADIEELNEFLNEVLSDYSFSEWYCSYEENLIGFKFRNEAVTKTMTESAARTITHHEIAFDRNRSVYKLKIYFQGELQKASDAKERERVCRQVYIQTCLIASVLQGAIEYYTRTQ